jgi:nucleoside-diphosphate-sugar epimerase
LESGTTITFTRERLGFDQLTPARLLQEFDIEREREPMGSRPPRLLITGASGYVGQRLAELAVRTTDIVALGRPPSTGAPLRAYPWRLGERPDPAAFDGVTAVVHLAHSWVSDAEQGAAPDNTNISGSEALARAAFSAGVPRFVFASTTSARAGALNAYGRIKSAIEDRLAALPEAADRLTCVRMGLVYGGPETGQYGLMSKLVCMAPILPMIGLDREVQPIHLDEVCAGLIEIATGPLAGDRRHSCVLAGTPMIFADWLRLLRRAKTGKALMLVPVPLWAALLACDVTKHVRAVPTVARERVLGLAGTSPMDSEADLRQLGIDVVDPTTRFGLARAERRRLIGEATVMLRYVSGRPISSRQAIAVLVRGIDHQRPRALGLPRFVFRCPTTLRAFEPLRPRPGHRLVDRLHLAAMVSEAMWPDVRHGRSNTLRLAGEAGLEALALPFRLVLGGRYR